MRIIDLSHTIDENNVYPGDPKPSFETVDVGGYSITTIHMGTHIGTHLDAPRHVMSHGLSVDQLPLEKLVGYAEVIELGELPENSIVTREMLIPFTVRIAENARVLLKTGWSRKWGHPGFFERYPSLDDEAVEWLVERKISLLGLEQPSINATDAFQAHKELLSAGIVIVENLANLELLSADRVWFTALPLKLPGLDGSPIRAIAVEM